MYGFYSEADIVKILDVIATYSDTRKSPDRPDMMYALDELAADFCYHKIKHGQASRSAIRKDVTRAIAAAKRLRRALNPEVRACLMREYRGHPLSELQCHLDEKEVFFRVLSRIESCQSLMRESVQQDGTALMFFVRTYGAFWEKQTGRKPSVSKSPDDGGPFMRYLTACFDPLRRLKVLELRRITLSKETVRKYLPRNRNSAG